MPRKPDGERALTSTERAREHRNRQKAYRAFVARVAAADIPLWSEEALALLHLTEPPAEQAK